MATITRIEDMEVWRLARVYASKVRAILKLDGFKFEFGLRDQMKNASGSIMDNIAEGFGRGGRNEFVNHLSIAKGSAEESKSQLYRCLDDGLIEEKIHEELNLQLETVIKKIAALSKYLNAQNFRGQKFKDRT